MVNTKTIEPLDSDVFPETLPPLTWSTSYPWGRTRRIRAEVFDLLTDLKKASTVTTWKDVCGISIYCDTVTYSGPLTNGLLNWTDLAFPWSTLRYLHIYTRDFLTGVQGLKSVVIGSQYELKISLVAVLIPPGLPIVPKAVQNPPEEWPAYKRLNRCVRLAQRDKGTFREVELVSGEAGWSVSIKPPGTVEVQSLLSVPPLELAEPTLAELYMYRKAGNQLKMLPKLLQLQLLAVSSEIFMPSPTPQLLSKIVSRLQFIVNCARNSVELSAFTYDVEVLLERIAAPYKYPSCFAEVKTNTPLFTPLLKPEKCLEDLKSRLSDVEKLEKDIAELSEKITSARLSQLNFATILEALAMNEAGYINTNVTENDVRLAVLDLDKQRAAMEMYKDATKAAKKAFEDGLQKSAKEQEAAAVQELWLVAGEFAVGIVVTFASGGSGAPAAAKVAADAGNAIKKASKTKEALKKLWEILKKLGEVSGDVGPKLMAAYQNQSTFKFLGKPTEANLKNEKSKEASDELLGLAKAGPDDTPALESASTDFLGMEAAWEEYRINIGLMFERIKDTFQGKSIEGMETYRQSLENQVIRGKTVLAAMKVCQAAVRAFLVQKAEQVAREKRRDELKATAEMLKSVEADRMRFRNETRHAHQQSLIGARRGLFISIHEVALAHAYTAGTLGFHPDLLNTSPTDTSKHVARADSSMARFRQTYEALQKALKARLANEANRQMSTSKATVDTSMETVFPVGWRELAVPYGQITFSIPPGKTLIADEQYYRMRVTGVWVNVFVGGKMVPGIGFFITFGPLMLARNASQQIASFYSSLRWLRGTTGSTPSASWIKQPDIIEPALLSEITIELTPADVLRTILPQSGQPANSTAGAVSEKTQGSNTAVATEGKENLFKQMAAAVAKIEKVQVDFEFEGIAMR